MAEAAAEGQPRKQEAMQHLIKSLAHNEKKIRDKSLKILQRWLSGKVDISPKDMMKIWQALFFCAHSARSLRYSIVVELFSFSRSVADLDELAICMWHSDKVAIQQELAQRLSKLIHCLPSAELSIHFISAFWRIMRRDWQTIDRLRLDKYLSLLRIFMHESFVFLKNKRWDVQWVQEFANIFSAADGPFAENSPLGIALHLADTTVEELCQVDTEVPATSLNLILDAFVTALRSTPNSILAARIRENVFEGILTKCAHEPSRCKNLKPVEWARRFFDVAAQPEISGKARKQLYALHSLYSSPPRHTPIEKKRKAEETEEAEEEEPNAEEAEHGAQEETAAVEEHAEEEAPEPVVPAKNKRPHPPTPMPKAAKATPQPAEPKTMQSATPKKADTSDAAVKNNRPLSAEKETPTARTSVFKKMRAEVRQAEAEAEAELRAQQQQQAAAADSAVLSTPQAVKATPKRILRSAAKGKKKDPSPKSVSFSEKAELAEYRKSASPSTLGMKKQAATAAPSPSPHKRNKI